MIPHTLLLLMDNQMDIGNFRIVIGTPDNQDGTMTVLITKRRRRGPEILTWKNLEEICKEKRKEFEDAFTADTTCMMRGCQKQCWHTTNSYLPYCNDHCPILALLRKQVAEDETERL